MVHYYKTRLCIWTISPYGDRWELRWYLPDGSHEISGRYVTPTLAAGDVADGSTGFAEWDHLSHGGAIADISNWRKAGSLPLSG
jgi:hypothetical protein